MANEQNVNIVRKLYEEVYSKGNTEILDQICNKDLTIHDSALPHQQIKGIQNYKKREDEYKKAFPDKKVTIDDIFGTDNKVIVRWTCQGTQKGELQDIAPTNKRFKIMGISIYTVNNGKITEGWQSWDRLGLLEQIGEIQPAGALH